MAAEDRPQEHYLTFLKRIADQSRLFSLFAALRGLEARAPERPPVGLSKLPEQDIADLRQIPHMQFPGSTLGKVEQRRGRAVLAGYWLGLTGPMSPLPLHLSEFALYEERYGKKRPFGAFLDLLAGRFLQLFYRAWASAEPATHADRTGSNRFADYVDALSGAGEGAGDDSAFPRLARLHYAALFASRRSAGAIEQGLGHLLGMTVAVEEFQPRWRTIAPADRTRLGGQFSTLGDAMLGARVLQVSDAFSVRVMVPDLARFRDLLPTGRLFPIASEALTALAPGHLEWDLVLCLPKQAAPAARLDGTAPLGWSSWLGQASRRGDPAALSRDVHLHKHKSRNQPGGRKS